MSSLIKWYETSSTKPLAPGHDKSVITAKPEPKPEAMNASQLPQEEALAALSALKILERNRPPPTRAVQVIAAHGDKDTFIFAMLRNPAVAGIESLDAWKIEGPLVYRQTITNIVRNQIAKRYAV